MKAERVALVRYNCSRLSKSTEFIGLFLVPFPLGYHCHLNYVEEDYTFNFIFKRLDVLLQKLRLRKRLRMLFLHAGETVYVLHIIFLFFFNVHVNYHSV